MAAKRGPKPKTVGTSRPKKAPKVEVPGHLEGIAREEYARVAERLKAENRLHLVDPRLIELYAVNYELVQQAQKAIQTEGVIIKTRSGRIRHPMVGVLNAATIRLRGLIADIEATSAAKGQGAAPEKKSKWSGLVVV